MLKKRSAYLDRRVPLGLSMVTSQIWWDPNARFTGLDFHLEGNHWGNKRKEVAFLRSISLVTDFLFFCWWQFFFFSLFLFLSENRFSCGGCLLPACTESTAEPYQRMAGHRGWAVGLTLASLSPAVLIYKMEIFIPRRIALHSTEKKCMTELLHCRGLYKGLQRPLRGLTLHCRKSVLELSWIITSSALLLEVCCISQAAVSL